MRNVQTENIVLKYKIQIQKNNIKKLKKNEKGFPGY